MSQFVRTSFADSSLTFLGAAGTVTGSKHMVEVAGQRVLVVESTYGDRLHEADDNGERLAAIINDTVARRGKLIIPSFAIGRVEEVLYWVKHLEDRNTIMFVGFQAAGTRGRSLIDGGKELKLLGRVVRVAARIERIDSMSAHADAGEIMRWLSGFSHPPRMTFLVHGERPSLEALAARITREHQWPVHIAADCERVQLNLL